MRGKDAGDAGRRKTRWNLSMTSRRERDTGRLAAKLAPPEERAPAGAGAEDTIRVEAADLKPAGGPLDEEEDGHGIFYMPPVVTVTVSLFLAYTLFVTVLIALG